jgi:short-chain Z-isoprenyl diphosphate synthase
MGLRDVVYGIYERRLLAELPADRLPRHVGAIVDGNRRWARGAGADVNDGYQAGADKVLEFVQWCDELGVQVVTLWVLSTDNLGRAGEEVSPLLDVITDLVDDLAATRRWRICRWARSTCCPPRPCNASRLPATLPTTLTA